MMTKYHKDFTPEDGIHCPYHWELTKDQRTKLRITAQDQLKWSRSEDKSLWANQGLDWQELVIPAGAKTIALKQLEGDFKVSSKELESIVSLEFELEKQSVFVLWSFECVSDKLTEAVTHVYLDDIEIGSCHRRVMKERTPVFGFKRFSLSNNHKLEIRARIGKPDLPEFSLISPALIVLE